MSEPANLPTTNYGAGAPPSINAANREVFRQKQINYSKQKKCQLAIVKLLW
jgi:hypothetical protein